MSESTPKKTFYCHSCRKDKDVEFKALNTSRRLAYCIECDDKATMGKGVYSEKKKPKQYTEKQLDNMIEWLNARGG